MSMFLSKSFYKKKITAFVYAQTNSFEDSYSKMVDLKLVTLLRVIILVISINHIKAIENQIDCKSYRESRQSFNDDVDICCSYSTTTYTNEIYDTADLKFGEFVKLNNNWIQGKENNETLLNCIYLKEIQRAAGFLDENKFNLEKFCDFVDFAEKQTNFSDFLKLGKSFAKKCIDLAEKIKVTEIQFKKIGIKPEECDFEAVFITRCINVNSINVR
jgi:hypothetical protein